jgi:hypothetical protein
VLNNDYQYDALHRATRVEQSDNPDAGSRTSYKRVDFTYNRLGGISTIERTTQTPSEYASASPASDLDSNPLPGAFLLKSQYQYDTLGRLVGLKNGLGVSTAVARLADDSVTRVETNFWRAFNTSDQVSEAGWVMGAPWYAVYVQTPHEAPERVEAATQREIGNNLELARQLGGTSLAFKGPDLVSTIASFVSEYSITRIIVGRSQRPWYRRWLGPSILDRLIQKVPGVDVLIVDAVTPRESKVG